MRIGKFEDWKIGIATNNIILLESIEIEKEIEKDLNDKTNLNEVD
ncbi:MAG: hypothetical protein NZ922_04970 [Candidatus Methanomethyliaceae archaeon]|nr:hypothetical protein [Candidatus Methanomethyliaceae archaeon]MDW7970717.1 hypothetical protein [Nitrososphaerota archaeon]